VRERTFMSTHLCRLKFTLVHAILTTLMVGVVAAQQTVEAWPPFEYYPERMAAFPDGATQNITPEPIPVEPSSVMLNSANTAEPLPEPLPTINPEIQTEGMWYPDYLPMWMMDPAWDGGLELGINATEGNAEAFSLRGGANLSRKSELWELKSNVIYAKSTSNGLELQHNAIFNTGYEYQIGGTPWLHFGKLSLEYDEFKAFDLRLAPNAGIAYHFVKTDLATVKGRFGAGVSHEINGPDDSWVPEAVFGADFVRQLSKRQKLTLTADYFPEWTDFSNFRYVSDVAWNVALDEGSKLSLKLSVNDRYDSTPHGRKPNDIIYALLLLWTP
jgi:putative salt-induced outer membrane protein YdiY